MNTKFSHEDVLRVLKSAGVGLTSVDTERGSVNGSALTKGDRISISVYTLEDPTVSPGKRCRQVLDEWADTPEEAARVLRRSVLRHAKTRKALYEAQRRIYTTQSVRG